MYPVYNFMIIIRRWVVYVITYVGGKLFLVQPEMPPCKISSYTAARPTLTQLKSVESWKFYYGVIKKSV